MKRLVETTKRYTMDFTLKSIVLFVLLGIGIPLVGIGQSGLSTNAYSQSIIHEGIQVKFSMLHIDQNKDPMHFSQNDDVLFQFEITDTLSGKAVTGAAPAAWMEPMSKNANNDTDCGQKISSFLGGSLFNRAELDLNVFYVLVMNEDASLTVVDPLFSFGGSQLLAYIELESVAQDWVVAEDQLHLFVSLPKSEKVAVVNTSDWKVEKSIPINAPTGKIELQPDGAYLWVEYNSRRIEGFSGVAAISTEDYSLKASISTGSGSHEIVISDDNRYVFVSNRKESTISVVDINTLKKIKDIPINGEITSMAWSSMAKAVYAIDIEGGVITSIDAQTLEIQTVIKGRPGISLIKFDPSGRYAFILGKEESIVQVLDVASNRIVQNGTTEANPIEVSFSGELAYVIHENSETILMFPLDVIGREGEQLHAADFSGGQFPPGKMEEPSFGQLMVQAPGANAMLIANNMDKTIYYYMEGMAAPMGNFTNYSKTPRAVEVIDRSLEERRPGVYETVGKIRGYGDYDIPFFVDGPRILHCFSVGVHPDENAIQNELQNRLGGLAVHHLEQRPIVKSNSDYDMKFLLYDPIKKEAVTGLDDVRIRGTSPGNWFEEGQASESTVPGVYQYNLRFEEAGVYYLYVECPSKELQFNNPQYIVIRVI